MNRIPQLMIIFNIVAMALIISLLAHFYVVKIYNEHTPNTTNDQLLKYLVIEQHNQQRLEKIETEMKDLNFSIKILVENKFKPLKD